LSLEIILKKAHSPFRTNIFLDSCAFDPKYEPEHEAALKLFNMYEKGLLLLEIAHSVEKEIVHPNTPSWVKKRAKKMIYTIEVGLTEREMQLFYKIRNILKGDGKVKNVHEDSIHIFEAQKYGSYFITTDKRILNKRFELCKLCSITILLPTEFIDLVNKSD